MKKYAQSLVFLAISLMGVYAVYAENLTVANFQPSPSGRYDSVSATLGGYLASAGSGVSVGPGATLTPTDSLEINGDLRVADAAILDTNAGQSEARVRTPVGIGLHLLSDGNNNGGLHVQAGTANVGIGTDAPAYTLHVAVGIGINNAGTQDSLLVNCPGNVVDDGKCYGIPIYS